MAALPSETNVRPYVPEAENVLISALGVYNTSEQLAAVGTVSPGMNIGIKNFWVTESEQYIYIGDQRDIITVWDTKMLQRCAEISLGDSYLDKLITLPNENAVIMAGEYGDTLFCYQPDGTLLWSLEDCSDVAYRPSAQCEAGSGILDVFVDAQYAYAVLQDGYDCLYLYDYNSCYETKCMKNGISQAVAGEGCYALHWYGDHITVYQNVMGTPAWETAFEKGFSVTNQKTCGQYLAFQDYSYLYLFDTDSKTLIWQTERVRNELLGFSADGKKLYYAEGKDAVIALDIAASKTESQKISLEETDGEIRGKLFLAHDCLYYTVGGMEVPKVVAWNLNTQEKKTCLLQPETEESIAYWSWEVLAAQGHYLWILGQDKMLLELNMTSGEVLCLAEQTTQRPAVAIHSSGKKVAITNQGKVYLKTPGQGEITTVVPENANAGSVCFDEDMLLVLCATGKTEVDALAGNWAFTPEQMENLGKMEHARWNAFHFCMGFMPMTKEEYDARTRIYRQQKQETGKGKIRIGKNMEAKSHACLISWDALDQLSDQENAITGGNVDYKQMDRNNILLLPELLRIRDQIGQ